ncbi:tetratricopeptide repeat protein [Pseudomonas sp. REP124]|uniref:tetratricopeptide repeat protein n=1 Tax=Pseudomonas sp. REP124 TaxID=2875731 RepID=UPI001CCF6EE3|nr:tetratricopeptide repeat protein [Pseudomonas sp. REP124]MBZ9780367.1 tetratricopeptide repeat protein [Pseudomonas sp. REP124]
MPIKRFLPGLILVFCAASSPGSIAAERTVRMQSNSASTTLIETASRQYGEGQLDQAAATLERALHIQPNNPATLHYLGVLRLQQGQYQQAETLAVRSNMRVGRNVALRNRNLQLIQAAQQAQASGTPPGAIADPVAVRKQLEGEAQRRSEADLAQPSTQDSGGESGKLARTSVEAEPAYDGLVIPRGHLPPPGKCRIWFLDRPPGQQPAPDKCKKLQRRVPAGAYLVSG